MCTISICFISMLKVWILYYQIVYILIPEFNFLTYFHNQLKIVYNTGLHVFLTTQIKYILFLNFDAKLKLLMVVI